MKKEYMKPTMNVVEIKRTTLLTTSSLTVSSTEITGSEMLAPSWEDDEEED
jgi:hypothetical protein